MTKFRRGYGKKKFKRRVGPNAATSGLKTNNYNNINITQFLNYIFQETKGYIEIRAIKKDGPIDQFFLHSPDELDVDKLKELNTQGYNIYFSTCTRKERSGKEKDVYEVPGIWVDVDGKDHGGKEKAKEKIDEVARGTGIHPSITVDSGGGYHLYFLLKESEVIEGQEDIQRIKGYVKGVANLFGGDHTHDLSRVLRLPGFKNLKYSPPVDCSVIHSTPDNRYNLHDFEEYKVEIDDLKLADVNLEDMPDEIPERFVELLKTDKKLKKIWSGRYKSNDKSGSGRDMALSMRLVKFGFSDGEIAKILLEAPYHKQNERTTAYLQHTISKATTKVSKAGKNENKSPYFMDEHGYLCRIKWVYGNPVPDRLSNFDAVIKKEIIEDDGVDESFTFEIEVRQKHPQEENFKTLGLVNVRADKFSAMNWVSKFGNNAIIEPGYTRKDCLRHAIQSRSNPETERIYTHTGWTWVGNNPVYLTSKGAIGADNVPVKLSEELQKYKLPSVPSRGEKSISTSLCFLDIGPIETTLPLYLTTYLAPLITLLEPQPAFVLYLYGPSGSFKTTISLLAQSHFGNFKSIQDLDSFESTVNHLGKRTFTLKDILMVIDDYHPSSSISGARKIESTVQQIIRRVANRTERGRLNPDATEKKRYTPRSMVVITAEELVTVQSTLARTFVVELEKGSINKEKLTELQNKSRALPYAMASYIGWIQENMDDVLTSFRNNFEKLRANAGREGLHLRIPETVAFLYFTAEILCKWLQDNNIFDKAKAEEFLEQSWEVLIKIAKEHQKRISKEDPVEKFQEILESLILQEKVKLKERYPDSPYSLDKQDHGEFIGYYDEDYLYLIPPAMWRSIQTYTKESNEYFTVSRHAFYKMLRERKMIVTDGSNNTIPQRFENGTRRVLKIPLNMLNFDVTDVIEG